ncbi:MAG TPA: FAD-dependent oxidoreductase [Propionibacteriaceae bacterium]|nr:FAD-dependent oxidoreductase [Propionibacteriaceae bacterium]
MAVLAGGIIRASTAAHLAERDTKVVLVTEGELGSGASGRSLSWLNSFAPLLGLIAGELLADQIVSGRPSPLRTRFAPDGFN